MTPQDWQWITGQPTLQQIKDSLFYLFDGEKLIINRCDMSPLDFEQVIAQHQLLASTTQAHYHQVSDDNSFITASVNSKRLLEPENFSCVHLRHFLLSTSTDNTLFHAASRAKQTLTWYEQHQYCGKCGKRTQLHPKELALCCYDCSVYFYPRISPCIIVLIYRDRDLLLARNKNFPKDFYSHVAGFIDLGETPEQCVKREAFEELGVYVDNIQYAGSQSWPFPQQLMLGFTARYKGGDIRPDGEEIVEADWWHADKLPQTPSPTSLSGALIAQFIAGKLPVNK